ncbi:hypothetical protein ACFXJ8_20505 [Nonomuraea sp. NPDC059194]|uniref:hypothetical protein n=1 Tax=Nonomuraea sp. NPDC059194 TaxID=3346764 RepID=UPI0036957E76
MTSTQEPAVRARPSYDPRVTQVERWFVRQGLPRLRHRHGRADTVTRMAPLLGLWAVALLALDGHVPLVLLGVAVPGALALRSWIGRPRRPAFVFLTASACLCLYGLAVLKVAETITLALIGTGDLHEGDFHVAFWTWVVIGGLLALTAYLCTGFGLMPLAGRALLHALGDLRNSFQLQARSMPMLLFLTMFFFFTGELWQLASRLSWARETLLIAIFATVAVLASGARLREEIAQIQDGLSIDAVVSACRGTPLADADACRTEGRAAAPLSRTQSLNLLFLLASRQLAQATVVGIGMFVLFVTMGMVLIDAETMQQWIGAPPRPSNLLPAVPAELLRVSLLLAGFSSMYFVFSTMVDPHYRKQFFPPVIRELERVLAVRTVYLALVGDGTGRAR